MGGEEHKYWRFQPLELNGEWINKRVVGIIRNHLREVLEVIISEWKSAKTISVKKMCMGVSGKSREGTRGFEV